MITRRWFYVAILGIWLSPLITNAKTTSYSYSGTVKAIDSLLSITIGKGFTIYNVNASKATMTRSDGTKMNLSEMRVGDVLNVQGRMVWTTINATRVVDLARKVKKYNNVGTITAKGKSSFFLESSGGVKIKVGVNDVTVIKKNGKILKFSDLVAGNSVTVTGTKEAGSKTLAALTVMVRK